MALGTPSIEKLLATRQQSIDKLQSREGGVEALQNGERTRLQNLLEETATLHGLTDTSFQIQAYGVEQWNNDFVRISELPGGTENEVWKQVRSTRFGRFQMTYCAPEDWIVPRLHRGRKDLDTMSLKGCLVRCDRIPDEFAVEIGFVDRAMFEEELHGDPIGRIAYKQRLTEPMKLLGESTVTLGSLRVQRIEPPSEKTLASYPNVQQHASSTYGAVLLNKEYVNGGKGPRLLMTQFYPNAASMLRKTLHQEHEHQTEVDFLELCETELQNLIIDLDRRYRKGTPAEEKAEIWTMAETMVTHYNDELIACLNGNKAEAAEFLIEAADLEDKAQKPNISRAMAKITAARGRLKNRFPEVKAIERYNMDDRTVLHAQLRREEHTLRSFRRNVTATVQRMEMERADERKKSNAYDKARRTIESTAITLAHVKLKPMRLPADILSRLAWNLPSEHPETFDDSVLTMHVIGKIQGLATSLDWLRLDCAKNGRIDFRYAANFARDVENAFLTEQILPAKNIPWIAEIMAPLGQQLTRMRIRLEQYEQEPPAQEDEEKVKEAFLLYLDSIDTNTPLQVISERIPEPKYGRSSYSLTK